MKRPVTDVKTLGAATRTQRTRQGWTQAQLAEQAQVPRRFVSEPEAGVRTGAQFGCVLAVLRALRLTINLADRGTDSFDDALSEVLRRLAPNSSLSSTAGSSVSSSAPAVR